jgi:hypothetical protein
LGATGREARKVTSATVPIRHPDYRAIEAHIDKEARKKGYKMLQRKGSTSWIDPRARPADSAVRFKLFNSPSGYSFGVREEWLSEEGLSPDNLGCSDKMSVSPHEHVIFRGFDVSNTTADKGRITAVIDALP